MGLKSVGSFLLLFGSLTSVYGFILIEPNFSVQEKIAYTGTCALFAGIIISMIAQDRRCFKRRQTRTTKQRSS